MLVHHILKGANLQNADLTDARLRYRDLRDTNLRGANLQNTDFQKAKNLTLAQVKAAKNLLSRTELKIYASNQI